MLARLAAVLGVVLRGVFAVLLRLRRPRPIHPRGVVLEGRMTWIPSAQDSGVRWIDDLPAAPARVVARLSRSIGLPHSLPDIIGLALRIEQDAADDAQSQTARPIDLELATTGIGVPSRFALVPRRSASGATFGCLLPYRTARGPLLVCARSVPARALPAELDRLSHDLRAEPWRVRLYWATATGKWHPFADLTLRPATDQRDEALRFDAGSRPPPGATAYRWVNLVRQPSYRLVQR